LTADQELAPFARERARRSLLRSSAFGGLAAVTLLLLNAVLFARNQRLRSGDEGLLTRTPGWVYAAILTSIAMVFLAAAVVSERRQRRAVDELNASLVALEHVTEVLLEPRPLDEFVQTLADRVREAVRADAASIHLRTATGEMELRASSGDLGDSDAAGRTELVAQTARTATAARTRRGGASVEAWPLLSGDEVLGVVEVVCRGDAGIADEASRTLRVATGRIAAAVDNARLQLEIASSEARVRALVEAAPLAIVELGLDASVRRWNAAASDLFGWPAHTSEGPSPALPAELAASLLPLVEQAARGVRSVDVEMRCPRQDAAPLELSVATAPLREGQGDVGAVLMVVTDVTSRKRLEQRLLVSQRMEAIGRLAGGVAHDFNNLLTVIIGYSDLLLRRIGDADPRARAEIEAIAAAGQQGAKLTSQLLAIGSHQVSEVAVVSVADEMADIEPMLRHLVSEDIVLDVHVEPVRVRIDPSQLHQIVVNLVVNARDAMPRGGRLWVRMTAQAVDVPLPALNGTVGPGEWMVLTVEDTGVGMDEEVLAHCFDPFFSTKDSSRGTGLGLPTVFGIVEQYDGRIDVQSAPGKGTTMSVYLRAFEAVDAGRAEDEGATGDVAARGSETILLAEDNDALRELVALELRGRGFEVLEASNGAEAVEVAENTRRIDLLLTDVVMPVMDGVELAARLTQYWPGLRVLYVSGYTGSAREKLEGVGPSAGFIAKPFELADVARSVRELLDRP
jgi:two-component system cell cycle sensor histidine kinase/response regulator CckA